MLHGYFITPILTASIILYTTGSRTGIVRTGTVPMVLSHPKHKPNQVTFIDSVLKLFNLTPKTLFNVHHLS